MEPLDGPPPSTVGSGPKKFAEPVALSSTVFADLPLAGSAFELGFDLLGSRARRKKESRARASSDQGPPNTPRPQFAEIQLSTFPQQGVQLVDNAGASPRRLESAHAPPSSVVLARRHRLRVGARLRTLHLARRPRRRRARRHG